VLAAIAVLALVGALALGWNSPRPGRPPDWEAPALPRRVDVVPGRVFLSLFNRSEADFTFEVIALPLADPGFGLHSYGLVYRAQDARHCYAFAVGTDGYYTVVRRDGKNVVPLIPWQQFPHIRRGQQSNRLLVTCEGSSCTFRINDEYATTVHDEMWLSGDVGYWAQSSAEDGAELQLLSARLWTPGP